ncbi:hypothetical protein H072_10357 [Dactylellina haptotyla CBS 200.50]|uniref:Carrier domain-containing protein n=1 Tax=Dactylellina haptotyla (strain CBS 200.50) TaxID=1284197 RepID=S7ZZT3_DACHA|nr:hypothetical protein H072_10357 [Dactylellina haptotyla CBS 200.50]
MRVEKAILSSSERLLPHIFEERAKKNPQGVYCTLPNSLTSYTSGSRDITHLEAYNAINHVAWLIEKSLGRGTNFETVTYIGPNDPRYHIVVLAGIKTGYKVFLPSPRNSKVAHLSLLNKLECKKLICTNPEVPCVPMILEDYLMQKLPIPSLQELFDLKDVPVYPYDTTYENEKKNPVYVLHTSGSTGIPKPIIYTHEYIPRVINLNDSTTPEGYENLSRFATQGRFFVGLPCFHAAGLVFSLLVTSFWNNIPVFPPPAAPPVTSVFIDTAKNTEIDWAFLSPVIVDEVAQNPSYLDLVSKRIKYSIFGGGSVSQKSGDIFNSKIPLYLMLGSSECSNFAQLRALDFNQSDWNYFEFHPSANIEFRHRFDDLYEMVVVKKPDPYDQPVFLLFPDLNEFETKDLYTPHPTKPGLWQHKARIDDVIVFLNGEKTNPISFEHEVGNHPEISAAVVAGDQRFEACLLIEPVANRQLSSQERTELIERIWPVVSSANKACPAHAKVSKGKILFTDPTRPMMRAGKGTVQRQATLNLYAEDIDRLYAETHSNAASGRSNGTKILDITATIRDLVKEVTELNDIKDDDDFFALGVDSLQVLHLVKELKLKFPLQELNPSQVYTNPSVEALSNEILRVSGQPNGDASVSRDRKKVLTVVRERYEAFIDGFARGIKLYPQQRQLSAANLKMVLLTGSTGSLGSYLLHTLLADETVKHIYCLNRSADSRSVQISRNAERQLPTDFPQSRVTFLTSDLSEQQFGLEPSIYNKLASSSGRVQNLICFAALASTAPTLLFLSSVGAAGNCGKIAGVPTLVSEIILEDDDSPALMGYGESKYLAERILDYASKKLDIVTGVVRITQITGPSASARGWNRNEWFPSLVLSSGHMGALPESLGIMNNADPAGQTGGLDWIPVDQLSRIIAELSFGLSKKTSESSMHVFHTVNPNLITWKSLLPVVRDTLQKSLAEQPGITQADIQIIPYPEWLERLEKQSTSDSAGRGASGSREMAYWNPGMKLLEFYKSLLEQPQGDGRVRFDTRSTLQACGSMRDLETIKPEWMAAWIKHWVSE